MATKEDQTIIIGVLIFVFVLAAFLTTFGAVNVDKINRGVHENGDKDRAGYIVSTIFGVLFMWGVVRGTGELIVHNIKN